MTPEERQKRIKALEAELEELKKAGDPARRFWELISGTELKVISKMKPQPKPRSKDECLCGRVISKNMKYCWWCPNKAKK